MAVQERTLPYEDDRYAFVLQRMDGARDLLHDQRREPLVLFPEPMGPFRPCTSPALTVTSIPFKARTPPKERANPSISWIGLPETGVLPTGGAVRLPGIEGEQEQ